MTAVAVFSNRVRPSVNYSETCGQMSDAAVLVLLRTALLAHELGLVKSISCAIAIFILKLLEKISFIFRRICIAFLSRLNPAVVFLSRQFRLILLSI